MKHDLARRSIQLPPQRPDLVAVPGGIERLEHKEPTKVIGQYAKAKEDRIGPELTAGHPFHPKTDLQLLDTILTVMTPLIVPLKYLLGGPITVRRNGLVSHRRLTISKEVGLVRTTNHYQAKGMTGLVHAMHGLGNMTALIAMPVIGINMPNQIHYRMINIGTNGIFYRMVMTVIEETGLIGRTVGTQGTNTLPRRHLPFTVRKKIKIPGRWRLIALSKLITHNQTAPGNMPHHGHVPSIALVGHAGFLLLSLNPRGIHVQRIGGQPVTGKTSRENLSIDRRETPETAVAKTPAKPVTRRVR
jgi:hypothetical protein